MTAKGFNLMSFAQNVDVDFVGRHLLDPVDSSNVAYIREKVREQLKGTSVTVVLIGSQTANSEWLEWEIDESLSKGNGILGIRLDPNAVVPEGIASCGAEVLNWYQPEDVHEFADAIERAAAAARRGPLVTSNASSCSR
jgi:hypothetical protein